MLDCSIFGQSFSNLKHGLARKFIPAQIEVNQESRFHNDIAKFLRFFISQLGLHKTEFSQIAKLRYLLADQR